MSVFAVFILWDIRYEVIRLRKTVEFEALSHIVDEANDTITLNRVKEILNEYEKGYSR